MKNKFDKIAKNSYAIIFGILSGSGLFLLTGLSASLITYLLSALDKYFLVIYTALHIFILIGTSKLYTRGLFKLVYVGSSLILLITYLYTKLLIA